jgi:hypothetical protein
MRRLLPVAAAVLGGVVLAHAGARRTVWMPPDASGTRPELGLFPSSDEARTCRDALAHARAQPGDGTTATAPGAGKPPGLRGEATYGPESVRSACGGLVGLKHATTVELLPPPGACGPGLAKVRVLSGTYRGRTGCVRADGLRVPGAP